MTAPGGRDLKRPLGGVFQKGRRDRYGPPLPGREVGKAQFGVVLYERDAQIPSAKVSVRHHSPVKGDTGIDAVYGQLV